MFGLNDLSNNVIYYEKMKMIWLIVIKIFNVMLYRYVSCIM